MDNGHLPIDVCERVIDRVRELYKPSRRPPFEFTPVNDPLLPSPKSSTYAYSTWLSTSLVCCAWRHRSQFNLFRKVVLGSGAHVDLLLRTLTQRPSFSELITALAVDAWMAYVPFYRILQSGLLARCTELDMTTVLWREYYPPRYIDYVLRQHHGHLRHITTLRIHISHLLLTDVLRLIWGLPDLQLLTLSRTPGRFRERMRPPPATPWRDATDGLRVPVCQALRTLYLDRGATMVIYPPHAFGVSVKTLVLSYGENPPSEDLFRVIRVFPQLQAITIEYDSVGDDSESDTGRYWHAFYTTLAALQPAEHLLAVTLVLRPGLRIIESQLERRYYYSREQVVGLLLGDRMQALLGRFPGLRRLQLRLVENDADYPETWWRERLVDRIARAPVPLSESVSVTVALIAPSVPKSDYGSYERLWRIGGSDGTG